MWANISSGQWYASNDGGRTGSGVVRVIDYRGSTVRYAQASYDGKVCKATDRTFLHHYELITEERATELLRGSERQQPKVINIPVGEVEELWFSAEAHLRRLALLGENAGLNSDCDTGEGALKDFQK